MGSQLTTMVTLVAPSMERSTLYTCQGSDLTASVLSLLWGGMTNPGLLTRSAAHWGMNTISFMDLQCPGTNGGNNTIMEWNHPWSICPLSHAPGLCPGHRLHHRGGSSHRCHPTSHQFDHHLSILTGIQQGWGMMWFMLLPLSTAWEDPQAHQRWNNDSVCDCSIIQWILISN